MAEFKHEFADGRIFTVEYVVNSHGSPASPPTFNYPGDPVEPPELEIIAIHDRDDNSINIKELPEDVYQKLEEAMYEQHIEEDDDYYDPDEWRD